jgi:hypothetical protein
MCFAFRFAVCLAAAGIVTCFVFTFMMMLSMGIGLGYNYCFVDFKTKHKYGENRNLLILLLISTALHPLLAIDLPRNSTTTLGPATPTTNGFPLIIVQFVWFNHRLSIKVPTKRGKEKSPPDGHCQSEKERDDHLLRVNKFLK